MPLGWLNENVQVDVLHALPVNGSPTVVHADEPIGFELTEDEKATLLLRLQSVCNASGRAHPRPVETVGQDRLPVQRGSHVKDGSHEATIEGEVASPGLAVVV